MDASEVEQIVVSVVLYYIVMCVVGDINSVLSTTSHFVNNPNSTFCSI